MNATVSSEAIRLSRPNSVANHGIPAARYDSPSPGPSFRSVARSARERTSVRSSSSWSDWIRGASNGRSPAASDARRRVVASGTRAARPATAGDPSSATLAAMRQPMV